MSLWTLKNTELESPFVTVYILLDEDIHAQVITSQDKSLIFKKCNDSTQIKCINIMELPKLYSGDIVLNIKLY